MRTSTLLGQPSWRLASSTVEAYLTEQGGHLAPVVFDRKGRKIQPYAIAPWWNEKLPASLPPLLKVLRGDFFCLPFGGNATPYRKEKHPPHGETSNRKWTFISLDRHQDHTTLRVRMKMRTRPGVVDKQIALVDGHNAVYSRHIIRGMRGPMTPAHHAILRFPDTPAAGVISTSPIKYGMVRPHPPERPEDGTYSILQPGAMFRRLERVRTITGEYADLSRYPARRGFEDIAILVAKPRTPFAWTAVTFPDERYVWFALKDPNVLKQTLLWMSNGGRHFPPWNGRHVNVMGLEELTSYFDYGLAESARPNRLTERGDETTLRCDPGRPLVVNYIMAVAAIPKRFDRVKSIRPVRGKDAVTLTAESGVEVTVPLEHGFLKPTA